MKKILFTIVLFVFVQAMAVGQGSSPVLENAVSKIKSTITDHIIEKAYLHFDRPYVSYVAGETIYFKAYVTMGELHEPSRISGVLHVDLIGKNNVLLDTKAIQLTNGVGWGDFSLPDTLQKGTYRIRAYTQWMRNGDPGYFFNKYISVSSINNVDKGAMAAKQSAQPAIQFFPEGGNLVADIHSKVAFKAVGTDGRGIDVKGIVFDSDGKAVAKITSTHLGMGAFDFIPEDGKKYIAKITYNDGSKGAVNLPDVESKGITLAVNTDDPSKVSIEIKANRAYYKENLNKELNLLIYWGGSVKKVNTKLDNEVLGLDLPTATFKTGILQATLFSQAGEPMNERLAFIQNNDLLNLSINTEKQTYAKRDNVKISLNAKNKDGGPVGGSFSVSVINESKGSVDENAESTILTNLLLTSDLKGYVESPNYYFANITKDTRADLDALMLTQGYRRFVWKQLLTDNAAATVAAYKPEQFIDIAGTVKTKAGVPIAKAQVSLVQSSGGITKLDTTDVNGNFQFKNMSFTTGESFIVKTRSSSGKNTAIISLNSPLPGLAVTPGNELEAKYNSNADILASIQSQRTGDAMASNESKTYLKNAENETPQKESYRSSNLGGPGHADQVIHGKDIKNAPNLLTALNGLARGVDFVNGVPYLKTSMVFSGMSNVAEPMLIVIDGNITHGTGIDVAAPRAVETVEILKGNNGAIYGTDGGAGVIVITTKTGMEEPEIDKEMSPGVYSFTPVGFYKAREFYSPRYEGTAANTSPDNRTSIFWQPDIITDADGNASFNFFNADGTGTYRVVVEGIDVKGNLGRQVFKYKVE